MGDLLRSGLTAFTRLRRDMAPGRTVDRWGREEDGKNSSVAAGGSNPRGGGRSVSPDSMLGEGLRAKLRGRAASFQLEARRLQGRRRRMLTATAVIVGVSAGGSLLAARWMPEERPAETLTIAARASVTPLAERFASEATMEEIAAPLAAAESRRTAAAPKQDAQSEDRIASRFATSDTSEVAAAEPGRTATAPEQDANEPRAVPQEPASDRSSRTPPEDRTAQAEAQGENSAGKTAAVAALEQRFAPVDDVAVSVDEIREELLTTGSILQPASNRSGRRPAGEEEGSDADPLMAALNTRAQEEPARETQAEGGTEAADGRSPGTVPIPEPRPTVETQVADARPEAGAAGEAAEADADQAAGAEGDAAKAGKPSRVTAHVNMRAKPENGATIVSVLNKGSAVEILECDLWCEVSAGGKTGFVYKSFVEGTG